MHDNRSVIAKQADNAQAVCSALQQKWGQFLYFLYETVYSKSFTEYLTNVILNGTL